jgi:hypothetical protein
MPCIEDPWLEKKEECGGRIFTLFFDYRKKAKKRTKFIDAAWHFLLPPGEGVTK